ncbi:MAG: acyltransferase [Spongiibacteraceae bacterium]|jgi:peptidoglycan/LPS O-acetylase OafA/YrhL|nr:acyltransferase [Spongiibacteraceae bacterium]
MPRAPQLPGLTSLRGIAALCVVVHNYAVFWFPDTSAHFPGSFIVKSYLWVDMFFLLSGFVLCHVYQREFAVSVRGADYRRFMLARFARIYPLHLFTLGLLVALELVALQLWGGSGRRQPDMLVVNLLLLQVLPTYTYWNEPAWSISAEWLTYLWIPLLMAVLSRMRDYQHLITAILCLLVLVVIEQVKGSLGAFYSGWPLLLCCEAEAILGAILYQAGQRHAARAHRLKAATNPLFIATIVSLCLPIPHTISVALFALLLLAVSRFEDGDRHWLLHPTWVWLGTISYSVYLLHDPLKQLISEVYAWLVGAPLTASLGLGEQWLVMSALIALNVALSHVCYRFVEVTARRALNRSRLAKRLLRIT